jgi:hypothetical protein
VVAWAGASDEFGIPQGFPEAKEPGWSGLSLSCPPAPVTAGNPWVNIHGQLAHPAFGGKLRWDRKMKGRDERCPGSPALKIRTEGAKRRE